MDIALRKAFATVADDHAGEGFLQTGGESLAGLFEPDDTHRFTLINETMGNGLGVFRAWAHHNHDTLRRCRLLRGGMRFGGEIAGGQGSLKSAHKME